MKTVCFVLLSVSLKCADTDKVTSLSAMKGDPVTLSTGVTKQQHDTMRWYFNNTLIAQINGDPSNSCSYDGEGGRFKDRLKVDFETGSLIITNIKPEHAGRYEAQIIRSNSTGTSQRLKRKPICNSTKIIPKSNLGDAIKEFNVTVSETESVAAGPIRAPTAAASVVTESQDECKRPPTAQKSSALAAPLSCPPAAAIPSPLAAPKTKSACRARVKFSGRTKVCWPRRCQVHRPWLSPARRPRQIKFAGRPYGKPIARSCGKPAGLSALKFADHAFSPHSRIGN
ncbi:uncharacterized protein LOC107676150 [Sinocyclocheilus anshuiensis]|uniref:uncharacterized protein LOC107676150 n=1 Tax=Sinocyclocheilus anshuiensis TaxID=1608454 RepID=UPI0007B9F663|nr:PREDICTED: uncharacterized protein LOC107676150 [Sinocyclocheilus anshuiensis]